MSNRDRDVLSETLAQSGESGFPEKRPAAETLAISKEQLSRAVSQEAFDQTRIRLFEQATIWASWALLGLFVLLTACVGVYVGLLCLGKNPPENFWHIPLMLVFMIGTILSITLTLTARFGSKHDKEDKSNLMTNLAMLFNNIISRQRKTLDEMK